MQVHFVARENGPERLVTETEVHFDEGPLAGARLVGFCLWKSPDGEVYVTFPSRAFGAGSERRYFDYLRAIDGDGETVKRRGEASSVVSRRETLKPVLMCDAESMLMAPRHIELAVREPLRHDPRG